MTVTARGIVLGACLALYPSADGYKGVASMSVPLGAQFLRLGQVGQTCSLCLRHFPGVRSQAADPQSRSALLAPEEGQGRERGHEFLFKLINFIILAGGLGYILRKPLAGFLSTRSASIRKSLEEGRKALEASQAQLQAVEEKLRHLEEELAAFKASAAQEMEGERQRLRQAASEEAEKVLASARAQIETAVRAAKLELKGYGARQAIELAEELIRQRLDDSSRKHLVGRFLAKLGAREGKN